ncbi:unnamed protein product [Nezara viridula]|uniref:Neuropeptide n=1 Tax=Nezara viridula TaxID=85310 RepID=A0A9P0HRJ0_NEZVI|nr:unnamed protein product [Nezara viridula]
MRCIFLIALVVFLAHEVLMYSAIPCLARLCSTDYEPVCGRQLITEGTKPTWEMKMFNNSCMMESANDCGKVSAQNVLMYTTMPQPCIARLCSADYNPVCGEQKVYVQGMGYRKDKKMFNSTCLMDSENDCGKANYKEVPCQGNY